MMRNHGRRDLGRRRSAVGRLRQDVVRVRPANHRRCPVRPDAGAEQCWERFVSPCVNWRGTREKQGAADRPFRIVIIGFLPPCPEVGARTVEAPVLGEQHNRGSGRGGVCGREIRAAGRAAHLRAHGPIARIKAAEIRMPFRQGNTTAVRPHRPLIVVPVTHGVHEPLIVVAEFEPFARVGEALLEGTQDLGQTRSRRKRGRRAGHHQVTASRHDGPGREGVINAALDGPSGDVHVHRHLVVQLDPFPKRFLALGMVHDLIEDQGAVSPGAAPATPGRHHHRQHQ